MFVKIVVLHKHFKMLHFWGEEKEYGDIDVLKYTRMRTTFNTPLSRTVQAGDWAEIWGDRTSSLNRNAYGNGWLLVIFVRYLTFRSSFSLFSCNYFLICDHSALRRVFSKLLRVL